MTEIKASEVITDALEDLVVQGDEAKIEQSEAMAAIRVLNDLMTSWDADGITLGYTIVSSLGSLMTVPLGAIRGIKANLALELAPKYDVPITQAMLKKARDGRMSCLNLAVSVARTFFPGNLPQGSGNNYPGYADQTFYPGEGGTVITETGGSIALEDETETSS